MSEYTFDDLGSDPTLIGAGSQKKVNGEKKTSLAPPPANSKTVNGSKPATSKKQEQKAIIPGPTSLGPPPSLAAPPGIKPTVPNQGLAPPPPRQQIGDMTIIPRNLENGTIMVKGRRLIIPKPTMEDITNEDAYEINGKVRWSATKLKQLAAACGVRTKILNVELKFSTTTRKIGDEEITTQSPYPIYVVVTAAAYIGDEKNPDLYAEAVGAKGLMDMIAKAILSKAIVGQDGLGISFDHFGMMKWSGLDSNASLKNAKNLMFNISSMVQLASTNAIIRVLEGILQQGDEDPNAMDPILSD